MSGVVEKYKPGQHPNSRANLIPFTPGNAPNPNGIKGPRVTPQLRFLLDNYTLAEIREMDADRLPLARALARALILKAFDDVRNYGDHARDTVIERIDGKLQPDAGHEAGAVYVLLQQQIAAALQDLKSEIGIEGTAQIQEAAPDTDC